MTTFVDATRRGRPSVREAAQVGRNTSVTARRRGRTRHLPGRVLRQVGARSAACERARRSGEWLWLTLVAIFTFVIVMLVGLFAPDDVSGSGPTAVVEVRAGDTLWDIASRSAPKSDPRVVVAQIVALNDLDAPVAETGQMLLVPIR